jgi:hypothetical protein
MSTLSDAFDQWIRGAFAQINTELENLYFGQFRISTARLRFGQVLRHH